MLENAACARDKAVVSLFADSGARRSELCNIRVQDLDLDRYRIKVMGKGGKEGFLIFGDKTKTLLAQHITQNHPQDRLFDLNYVGVKSMLNRLGNRTGRMVTSGI
ncbi:MAG: tyrosine-type recombinase/integrase [Chloroflexi bacterium]|nr:tyrosine-type recombinase/integrase [Chloroflexota bacterium]